MSFNILFGAIFVALLIVPFPGRNYSPIAGRMIDFVIKKGKKTFPVHKLPLKLLKTCKAHKPRGDLLKPVNLILATVLKPSGALKGE